MSCNNHHALCSGRLQYTHKISFELTEFPGVRINFGITGEILPEIRAITVEILESNYLDTFEKIKHLSGKFFVPSRRKFALSWFVILLVEKTSRKSLVEKSHVFLDESACTCQVARIPP